MSSQTRVLFPGLLWLSLLSLAAVAAAQSSQGVERKLSPSATTPGQTLKVLRKDLPPPTLEQRIGSLEDATARLQDKVDNLERASGDLRNRNLAPVRRVPRDDSADDPRSVENQIRNLWSQIDQILAKLDEITSKQ